MPSQSPNVINFLSLECRNDSHQRCHGDWIEPSVERECNYLGLQHSKMIRAVKSVDFEKNYWDCTGLHGQIKRMQFQD